MECSRAEAVAAAERGEAAAEGARTAAKDAERAKRTAERKLVRPSTNNYIGGYKYEYLPIPLLSDQIL